MYKRASILLLIILAFNLQAQERSRIETIRDQSLYVPHQQEVRLFSPSKNVKEHLIVQPSVLSYIKNQQPNSLKVPMDLHGKTIQLSLQRKHILPNTVATSDGTLLDLSKAITYQGVLDSHPNSWATMIVNGDFLKLTIAHPDGNYEIVKSQGNTYQLLDAKDYEEVANLHCRHGNEEDSVTNKGEGNRMSPSDCIDIYIEVDFASYQVLSNVTNATNWATSIFNDVATIYATAGVTLNLSDLLIWNTSDPYSSADLISKSTLFAQTLGAQGFNGTIAHLFSVETLNGGISVGIGGYCNDYNTYPAPFAISTSMTPTNPAYPVYSYNVMNVSHELGHVMGLRHTHACVWNDDGTQIDDCGNVYAESTNGTPEGTNCFESNNPILPPSGTIMSYCHLVQGNSINLANGFHPLVRDLLYNNFTGASCQLGNSCGEIPPSNDFCVNAIPLTATSACSPQEFDFDNATDSGITPGFSCSSSLPNEDVWFKVIIPDSGNLTVESTQLTGGARDMIGQAYSGSCGSLVQILCDNNSGSARHFRLDLANQTPGVTVYVRVKASGEGGGSGNFGLCAYDSSLPCHPDFDALVDLYNSTISNGPWTNGTGWTDGIQGSDCDICSWQGVVCNSQGRVITLNLGNNNLAGQLPASMTDLTSLQRVNLYSNALNGGVPLFIDDMILLSYVDLGNNNLTGSIPNELGSATNLRTLYLDNNGLGGELPQNLINTPVTSLWLQNNQFSGCIPYDYHAFCTRGASVRLEQNTQLPLSGDFSAFCNDGTGGDQDLDGYCAVVSDCLDDDPLSYPGAPERCDGLDNDCDDIIDEGLPRSTNQWTGSNSNNWHENANWSEGVAPATCHDVVISGSAFDTIFIRAFNPSEAASVTISSGKYLWIQNNSDLTIDNQGNVSVMGHLVINGNLNISNASDAYGLNNNNSGQTTIRPTGRLNLANAGSYAIRNVGTLVNRGIVSIESTASSGVLNTGLFSNYSSITILTPSGTQILNQSSGAIELEAGSSMMLVD